MTSIVKGKIVGLVAVCAGAAFAAEAAKLPQTPRPSETYAAEEYAAWTAKLTGGKAPELEIVRDDTLGEDGFRLRNVGGRLVVSGGRRGVLYGVYEALERFGGIEWLSVGTTVVPANGVFRLPEGLDEVQKPAFELRQPLWYDVMHNADLAARMKLNSSQLQERHGGCSHLFDTKLRNCHTFEWLVPQEDYWKDHPEYYSEWEGKRRKGKTQLCLTNPDVLRIVTEKVLQRIEANPGAKYFGISQNDWGFYCTCTNCAAVDAEEESHAGTVIRFVNAVADKVAKRHPDKVIETLAYQWSRKPPKKTRVRANVMPCLCSIECEFKNPLAASEFAANRSFMDDLRGWAAQTDQLYVWDYTTDYANYLYPFPNVLVLQENIRTFRANKVKSLFEQGAYQGRHADFAELKTWLIAKWMWNPDQPLEPLLKRFFDGYYGAAAAAVRRYFDELHALPRKGEAGNPLSIYESAYAPSMTDDFLERAARLWDEAERLVKDDPVRSYNVRMGRLPLDVTRLLRHRDVAKRWPEYRALAARTLAAFGEAKTIRISEAEKYDEETLGDWRKMAACATFADAAKDLSVDTLGKRNPSFAMNRFLFEGGKAYTLRVHVRGGGFEAGVNDWDSDRSQGKRKVESKDLQDGWAWYDLFTWRAQDRSCFWFNPLDEQTEIDRVELVPESAGLPVLELSADAWRQTFVAQGTKETYEGHPTTLLSDDQRTMFCIWTPGHGGAASRLARSDDGGRSWTRIDELLPADYVASNLNCPTFQKIKGPDGKTRYFAFSCKLKPETDASGRKLTKPERLAGLGILMSEDDGRTWRELPSQPHLSAGMPPTGLMQLKDGTTALFGQVRCNRAVKTDGPNDDQEIWMSVSRDGGFTWGEARVVASKPGRNLCEPCCLRSPDGRSLALLMRDNRHTGPSAISFSHDEGRTWSEPRDTQPGLTGDRHEAVMLPDGRYFIAFRNRHIGDPLYGQFMAWVGTWDDLVRGGKGQCRVHLLKHHGKPGRWPGNEIDTGYPGVELLPDGTIVCTTYTIAADDGRQSSVVSMRLNVKELDSFAGDGIGPFVPYKFRMGGAATAAEDLRNISKRTGLRRFLLTGPGFDEVMYAPFADDLYAKMGAEMAEVKRLLSDTDIELGWWCAPSIRYVSGFASIEDASGNRSKDNKKCPLDPAFQSDWSAKVKSVAAAFRPAMICIEDDYTLAWGRGLNGCACFCPRHLASFASRYGKALTGPEIAAAFANRTKENEPIRRAFAETVRASLAELAGCVRAAVDEVDPSIRIMLCESGACSDYDGDALETLARTFSGPGTRPCVRPSGAIYGAQTTPADIPPAVAHTMFTLERLPRDIETFYEADPYPHNRFFTSAAQMQSLMAGAMFMGSQNILFYCLQYLDDPLEDPGYAEAYRSMRPRLETVRSFVADRHARLAGVRVLWHPEDSYLTHGIGGGHGGQLADGAFLCAKMGLPYTTRADAEGPVMMMGNVAETMSDDEIRRILSGGVLLDAPAAALLQRRGFGAQLGADVELAEGRLPVIGERLLPAAGLSCKGRTVNAFYILSAGTEGTVTAFATLRPRAGTEVWSEFTGVGGKLVTPSVTYATNSLGGRVAILATSLLGNRSSGLYNLRKQELLRNLFNRLAPGTIPVAAVGAPGIWTLTQLASDGKEMLVMVNNLSGDERTDVEFDVHQDWVGASVSWMDRNGALKPLGSLTKRWKAPLALGQMSPEFLVIEKKPALVLRFDDNKSPQQWQEIAEIFEAIGGRCSFAVNPAWLNEEQWAKLRELSARGHEIMDHTPQHAIFKLEHDGKVDLYRPEVDLAHAGNVRVQASMTNGVLRSEDPAFIRVQRARLKFFVPSTGKFYGLGTDCGPKLKESAEQKCSDFWGRWTEDSFERCEVVLLDDAAVQPSLELLRAQARESVASFKAHGLPPPKTWIRPGGWEGPVDWRRMKAVYGDEFGYKIVDAAGGEGLEPYSPWNYGSDFGFFDFEPDVEKVYSKAAAALAGGHSFAYISHQWTKNRAEYLNQCRQLAEKLKANGIRMTTYSHIAD